MAAIPDLPPNPAKYCSHKVAIANLAKVMSSPGYHPGQFRHVHDPSQPGKKSGKKKSRKKRPYSGILTQQMIESRENERQRINQVNMNLNCNGELLKLNKLGRKIGLKNWVENLTRKSIGKRGIMYSRISYPTNECIFLKPII